MMIDWWLIILRLWIFWNNSSSQTWHVFDLFFLDIFLNNIKKITQDLSRTLYCGIVSWYPALSCLCSSFIVRYKGGKTYKISYKSLLTLCTGDLSHVSQRDCSSRRCGQSWSGKCKQLLLYQAQRLFTSGVFQAPFCLEQRRKKSSVRRSRSVASSLLTFEKRQIVCR